MAAFEGSRAARAGLVLLFLGACGGQERAARSDGVEPAAATPPDAVGPTATVDAVSDPVVAVARQHADAPHADLVTKEPSAVVTTVTFEKSRLLGRSFLYGSDIQYSGKPDGSPDSVLQSLALGHVPAKFRIVGSTLQLLSDASALFESDLNRPERLLAAWPIVAERGDRIAVEIRSASPALVTLVDDSGTKERTSWVRSLDYVRDTQLLLLETSIEAPDGTVWQFAESLFPREALVRDDFNPLSADPATDAPAQRYRFLSTGPFWLEEQGARTAVQRAIRYDLRPRQVIRWWVTPNVPDEYLEAIENAVVGWNRYFRAMGKGDAVVFEGKLPAGVKLGDPRFNVINWDSVADAPAAYESQAYDPTTGVQSHSLVYLPYAWVNIGREYWQGGRYTHSREGATARLRARLAGRTFLGRPVRVRCQAEPTAALSSLGDDDVETFAKNLLRGTLFHEVGHALGLDHNFKASLSFDPERPETFSTSIMDYNQYEIERAAFRGPATDRGPLLEYDRQVLSVLYNEGRDVRPTDPVLPACNDQEADDVEGGIDPLCLRYDAGADPSIQALTILRLLNDADAKLGAKVSLPAALGKVVATLGDPSRITTWEAALDAVAAYANAVYATVGFYTADGAASFRSMTDTVLPGLYVERRGVAPEGFDLAAYRARVYEAVSTAMAFTALPKASHDALVAALDAVEPWVRSTPAFAALDASTQAASLAEIVAQASQVLDAVEGAEDGTLVTRVRTAIGGALRRVPTAPFDYVSSPLRVDYEERAVALLEAGLTAGEAGASRPLRERTAYAKALRTFADTERGREALDRVATHVAAELAAAPDARSREALRALLATLAGG